MYKAYQSSFNIKKYFIFLKTTHNLNVITLDFNTDELFVFTKLHGLLYADDTIILADNETSFQQSLNSFNNYCEVWKLKINKDKSKVMIFGAKKTDCFNFYIGKTKLFHFVPVLFDLILFCYR